jgi:sulfite reductase (NADPH) flavoprotein alpha-component
MSSPNRLFSTVIKKRERLTKTGSTKEVYHLVLSNPGITFKVGDSIAVHAQNDPPLVHRILRALKAGPQIAISHPRSHEMMNLETFLLEKANLSRLPVALLKLHADSPVIQALLDDKNYFATTDVLDFLLQFPQLNISPQVFANTLFPLLPRFYSVASSPITYPDEIHLMVAVSSYDHHHEHRYGVASHFLCHLAEIETTRIPCYVQPALHFTLPHDNDAPIIMVGPGTGVAPFRGFLQERLFRNAFGKNWLFFGERHREHDFFYEEFWDSLIRQNRLSLDLAFSRDQPDKIYVQHKLYDKGLHIWNWLQEGAYLYVCGDADPMARDVELTLHRIFCEHGKLSDTEAKTYLKHLRQQKRYLIDVY